MARRPLSELTDLEELRAERQEAALSGDDDWYEILDTELRRRVAQLDKATPPKKKEHVA